MSTIEVQQIAVDFAGLVVILSIFLGFGALWITLSSDWDRAKCIFLVNLAVGIGSIGLAMLSLSEYKLILGHPVLAALVIVPIFASALVLLFGSSEAKQIELDLTESTLPSPTRSSSRILLGVKWFVYSWAVCSLLILTITSIRELLSR